MIAVNTATGRLLSSLVSGRIADLAGYGALFGIATVLSAVAVVVSVLVLVADSKRTRQPA